VDSNSHGWNTSVGKWRLYDYIILVVQIIFPAAGILIVLFVPTNTGSGVGIPEDIKITLIGLAIAAPLIVNQISMTNDHLKADHSFQELNKKLEAIERQLVHINPMLERAFLSGNDRVLGFAIRRLDDVNPLIEFAVNNLRTDTLKPREYYNELTNLAKLLKADKQIYGEAFTGEVWALTGFSEKEWTDRDGYEFDWTQTLLELIDMGIPAKRLCIVDRKLLQAIESNTFAIPEQEDVRRFPGFLQLMKDYYTSEKRRKLTSFYIINENTNETISRQGGFFRIKLTDGEMHILTGEAVDNMGSLTAVAWFDEKKIKDLRTVCEDYMKTRYAFGDVVRQHAKPDGFLKFIEDECIVLP